MAKKNKTAEVAPSYDDSEWRAEEDARTLLRANEIRADKGRLAKAKAWAAKRATELKSVTALTAG